MSNANEPQLVRVKLLPALSADEKKQNIVANIVIEGQTVPYIDDAASVNMMTQLESMTAELPRLRYYAVGPGTLKIKCPLCEEQGNAALMRVAGIKDLGCCLSWLSCIFPLFWICCLCSVCGCNRQCNSKGLYCNKCGGKLGIERKLK